MKLVITADIPNELARALLQHIRDFDVANSGCHFQVAMFAPDSDTRDMIDALDIKPPFAFKQWRSME